jgi:hypothetical protein
MGVVITVAAKADLFAIRHFIEPHNPGRVLSFVEELPDRCQALPTRPGPIPWFQTTSDSGFAAASMAMT